MAIDASRTVLIVNPRAGRGSGALAGALAEAVLRDRGVVAKRLSTAKAGDAAALARAAAKDGATLVVAVGGDGTLHEVLNGLIDPAVSLDGARPPADRLPALATVPVGSGNDYVKMLGIPRSDPRAAAAAILDGDARAVDVGLLEGAAPRDSAARSELFLNNLGLAFAGVANARIDQTRGLPGDLAYFVGSVIEWAVWELEPYELVFDGRSIKGKPTLIHVNLGRFCGGGIVFTPEASLEDGLFDIFYLAELTRVAAAIRWHAVTHGEGTRLPDVTILRGSDVVVRGRPGFVLHADGEVRVAPSGEVRARVIPKAVRVVFGRDAVTDEIARKR